jgi:transcriptional regulator with AAA-type ATPase domain
MAIKFNKNLPNEVDRNDLLKVLNSSIDKGLLSSKDLYALGTRANSYRISKNKTRIRLAESLVAYQYLLDNNCTVVESLCYALAYRNLPDVESYVNSAKNLKIHRIKTNVAKSNKHPVQKAMAKYKTLNRKSLNKCKTPNEQLTELLYQKTYYNRIKELEAARDKAIVDLSISNIQEDKIKDTTKLINTIDIEDNNSIEYKKAVASVLKTNNYTQKDIAKVVGKTQRTIQRWWKDL